jgi:hypothetical protein
MKNILIIDVDTERTPVTQIGKMEGSDIPKNKDEAKESIIKDMACLTEGLVQLIHAANDSNFKTKEESLADIVRHIEIGTSDVPLEADVKITQLGEDKPIDNKEE